MPFAATAGMVAGARVKERNWLFAPVEPTAALWSSIARWRAAINATAHPAPATR